MPTYQQTSLRHKKRFPLILHFSNVLTLVFVGACKPQSKNLSDAETMSDQQSLQNMKALIDTGLAQLDEELKSLEQAEENEPLGLTAQNTKKSSKTNTNFFNLFQRVSSAWQLMQGNPCRIWAPIIRNMGKDIPYPYFFIGASAEAGAGLHGIIGRDYVWDLYNLQVAAFNYKSLEMVFGSGTVGAAINTYIGLGFGRKNDVNEAWSGRFLSSSISGSLPVLSDYLSGHISYFSAQTPQGLADPRFRGGSIGLSLGVSAPTGVPAALQVSNGNWIIDNIENKKISQRLASFGVNNSMQGSATCQGGCVRIDNISRGAGYTGRAVNLARSIAVVALNGGGGLIFQGIDKIMLLAIATGAYRDNQNNARACQI